MRDEWFDFMPILILFLFICYPYEFVKISETSLGKLFALFLIIYYASVDLVWGILVCAIVILYYHIEFTTSIWSIERSRQMQETMMNMMKDMDKCNDKCGGKCGGKCDGKGCDCDCDAKPSNTCPNDKCPYKKQTMPLYEAFQQGDSNIFKYESEHGSGRDYNESVLGSGSGSNKTELKRAMGQTASPMYSPIENTSPFLVGAPANGGPLTHISANNGQLTRNSVVDRIFEKVK